MPSRAIAELTAAFHAGLDGPAAAPRDRARTVITSWPTVPVEVIRAAGLTPFTPRGSHAATPLADRYLERDVFPSRVRQLANRFLAGDYAGTTGLVIPRTSDSDYKLFLYLREFQRLGAAARTPVYLFDLLQSRGDQSRAYGRARTAALIDHLGSAGHTGQTMDLARQIAQTNAARDAARALIALRQGQPRLTGTEALPLIGAFWLVGPERYVALAREAADDIRMRQPLDLPRVLLAGAPVDDTHLHAAIESLGAVVVAETSPWGSGAARTDVRVDADPIQAIADFYRTQIPGARVPASDQLQWLEELLAGIDAVVVSLPPDDAVFGWEYPDIRARLDVRGVPSVCVSGDPHAPIGAAELAAIAALLASVKNAEAPRG